MPEISPGRYRHYKGNEYVVIGVARHSENEEEFVVYRQAYPDFSLWIRPKRMFLENVPSATGEQVPRFEFLSSESST